MDNSLRSTDTGVGPFSFPDVAFVSLSQRAPTAKRSEDYGVENEVRLLEPALRFIPKRIFSRKG